MPILLLARLIGSSASLILLGLAAYFLWTWQGGGWVATPSGDMYRDREHWRLWTGLGLLAWSFVGRHVTPFFVANPDQRRTTATRGAGRSVASPTGSTLYVESHGPAGAPRIIFTHGWGMDSTFWNYAKQDLSDRFHLVVWDLPGLGRSRLGRCKTVSLDAFAEDLANLMATAGGMPVLVGHSIGGMTIQTLIRNRPDLQSRLAGLVLLNTTYTNPLETMVLGRLWLAIQKPVLEPGMKLVAALQPIFWLLKWQSYLSGASHLAHRLGFGRFVTRSQLEHSTLLFTRNPPGVLAKGNVAMMNWDATDALAGLRIPALVIGGDRDIVTKLDASRVIASESDAVAIEVVQDVNHMGPMERADRYNGLIAQFVLAVQPGAAAEVKPKTDGLRRSDQNGGSFPHPPLH